MANLNVQLSGASLQVIDNTGNIQRVNSQVSTLSAAATASFYDSYLQLGVGNLDLVLPAATIWVVWVKNLHASQTVTVSLTPAGGAMWINGVILVPGAIFSYFAPYSSNPGSGGVTGVRLTASGAATPVELLVAA